MVVVRVAETTKRQHVPSAHSDSIIGADCIQTQHSKELPESSKHPQADVLECTPFRRGRTQSRVVT